MKVLDLDMDYFMKSIAHTPFDVSSRLSEKDYGNSVWTKDQVITFLEENLGLSKEKKIPGRIVIGHNESLFFWEELISNGELEDPFEVVHVDSHADLGLGCASANFLQGEILTLPIKERRKIRNYKFCNKIEDINVGDYLLWGIAYRMISKIVYCDNPNGDKDDYRCDTLKDFQENFVFNTPTSNFIQLTFNQSMKLPIHSDSKVYKDKYLQGAIKEPVVELKIIPTVKDVKFYGDFDFAVMAQSPNYTPKSADFILNIFREYINEI